MESNKVTVIVAIYNVAAYLETCLDSIIGQTYRNIDIILVNDGSTDSSLDICRRYLQDDRVSIIDKKNNGLSSTRQAGIDNAQGIYICMMDADDYLEQDFVEKMHAQISADESDICVCASRFYSEGYSRVYGFSDRIDAVRDISMTDLETDYCRLASAYYMSDSWNKIYKAGFIRDAGVRFSLGSEYNGTDLLFNHLLMLHLPRISIVNIPLYNHQILGNSRVRRKDKQLQKGFITIMDRLTTETQMLNCRDAMDGQLSRMHVIHAREASQDLFDSGLSDEDLETVIADFHTQNRIYLSHNRKLRVDAGRMDTWPLKMYCYCLKSSNSSNLSKYHKFRRSWLMLLRHWRIGG